MLNIWGQSLLARHIYVMVAIEGDTLVPYTDESMQAILASGSYGKDFTDFLIMVLHRLGEDLWPPGSYYPGGLYRAMTGGGIALGGQTLDHEMMRPYFQEELLVTPEGQWKLGNQAILGKVKRFFLEHLQFDGLLQRYMISYPLDSHVEKRYLHHQSPPYRVLSCRSAGPGLEVSLNDGRCEALDPRSLRLDRAERLYCAVKAAKLPALFSDPARFALLDRLEVDDGRWILALPEGRHSLNLDGAWPYQDTLPE